jgi:hypothetical protein
MEIQDDVFREILQAAGSIAIDRERLNVRLVSALNDLAAAAKTIEDLKAEQEKIRASIAETTHAYQVETSHLEAVPDPGQ